MEGIIKFIHTGDIHLGVQFSNVSFSREKAMDRRLELWSTFQRIVEYSIEENVDFLFIAGDLFEADYFTIGDINRVRDILAQARDVNILITAGNHDTMDQKSLYNKVAWSENVTIFKTNGLESEFFPDLNLCVYGYSWDKLELKENTLFKNIHVDETKNNILILHGDVSNTSNYLPISLEDLNKLKMDYVALGHIHKPNLFTDKIAYCGSPEPLDFGEQGPRGIISGVIDKGSTMIEFLPFSKRVFYEIKIDLNGNHSYLEIINMIKTSDVGNMKMDLYRIILNGYVQADIDLSDLEKEVEEYFYYIEIINRTTPDYDLELLEESNKNNLIGQYIKSMKEKNLDEEVVRDALYIGLSALLKVRE